MKKTIKYNLTCLLTLLTFGSLTQQSFEFSKPVPTESDTIQHIHRAFYGVYQSEQGAQIKYDFSDSGVYILTIAIQSISVKTLKESPKYKVRNGYLFGVDEDSIPCIQKDDNYFFGIRNTKQIIGDDTENILTYIDDSTYMLNFKTSQGYVPSLFEFQNNQLFISQFDYDSDGKILKSIKNRTELKHENNLTTTLLTPNNRKWQKVFRKGVFNFKATFNKQF